LSAKSLVVASEILQRGSVMPAFLRDKSRAPGPPLARALNTYAASVSLRGAQVSASLEMTLRNAPLPSRTDQTNARAGARTPKAAAFVSSESRCSRHKRD